MAAPASFIPDDTPASFVPDEKPAAVPAKRTGSGFGPGNPIPGQTGPEDTQFNYGDFDVGAFDRRTHKPVEVPYREDVSPQVQGKIPVQSPRPSALLPPPDLVDHLTTHRAQVMAAQQFPEQAPTQPQPEPPQQQPQQASRPAIGDILKVLPRLSYGLWQESQKRASEPAINFEKLLPKTTGPGVIRGAAEFASSLTSPQNLILMGGTAGLGELAPSLAKLLSLGFSSQMLWDALRQTPDFAQATARGDWGTAKQVLTKIGLSAAMAAAGVRHATSVEPAASSSAEAQARAPEPRAAEREATPPAAAAIPPRELPQAEASGTSEKGPAHTPASFIPDQENSNAIIRTPGASQSESQPETRPVPGGSPGQRGSEGPENGPEGRPQSAERPAGEASSEPPAGSERAPGRPADGLLEEGQRTGPHGPVFPQFHGDAQGAIAALRKAGSGEAPGALHHPELGDIDLVWGKAGDPAKDFDGGYGLAHIEAKHPGIADQLPEIIADAKVSEKLPDRARLETPDHMAVVRMTWDNQVKQWLVTAFEKRTGEEPPPAGRTSDIPGAHEAGWQAPPPGGESQPPTEGSPLVPGSEQPKLPGGDHPSPGDSGSLAPTTSSSVGEAQTSSGPTPPETSGRPDSIVSGEKPEVNRTGSTEPPRTVGDPFSTMHGGLPLDVIGSIFKADAREAMELAAKRNAALKELERAKASPEEKKFGQRVLEYFTGERDLWATRVNQAVERLRKLVPDPIDQEALSLMRDFKKRPGELQAWLDGSHPNLRVLDEPERAAAIARIQKIRPAIERALNPSQRMLSADRTLTHIADVSMREGQHWGFIDRGLDPERYFTHLLWPKGVEPLPKTITDRVGAALGNKIGREYAFNQRREYPTVIDAIADNVKPKTLNAFDAATIHGDKFATARATHMLIQELRDTELGKWGSRESKNIPDGWVEIAPHARLFRNNIQFEGENGETQFGTQTLFVPPVIERALRPITDPDYLDRIPMFRKLRAFQAYTKAVQLGLSFFHATTENYMALANMGPKGWLRGLRADRESPEFLRAEREFIAHGGTSAVQGKTVEAYKSLQPGSIPTWGDIWRKAPVIREVDELAQKLTDFTFGNLQRKFKVTDYQMHTAAWLADHMDATPEQQRAAFQSIAKEVNAVYGGLHWENLGVNHQTVEVARALMLAPDWTISNLFNVKYATERGTEAGKLARMFWIRTLVGGLIATQLASLGLSGHLSKNPTQVYMGNDRYGQEIYQNVFFKGAPGDAINLVNNVNDYGAVGGMARSMAGKAAPVFRTSLELLLNRDYLGHELIPQDMNPVASTARGALEAAKGLAPTPLSIVNLKDMLIGPHAGEYRVPEWLTTPFAGTPPHHKPPAGTKMSYANDENGNRVPVGLEFKEPPPPRRSILEEIVTGKR